MHAASISLASVRDNYPVNIPRLAIGPPIIKISLIVSTIEQQDGGFNLVLRVSIDNAVCQGHGRCYTLAPEVFQADEVGQGLVVTAEVQAELEEKALLAEENCPENAISCSRDLT